MLVSVYKVADGVLDVLVQASPGKGLSPVLLQAITSVDVVERVGKLVEEVRRPRNLAPAGRARGA